MLQNVKIGRAKKLDKHLKFNPRPKSSFLAPAPVAMPAPIPIGIFWCYGFGGGCRPSPGRLRVYVVYAALLPIRKRSSKFVGYRRIESLAAVVRSQLVWESDWYHNQLFYQEVEEYRLRLWRSIHDP